MKIIEEVEGYFSDKVSLIKTLLSMIKLEAVLAGATLYPLLLNLCMIFIVLMAIWCSIMLLAGYFFFLLFNQAILAVALVMFVNVLVLFALLKYLTFNLKCMSFSRTREYIFQNESLRHEQLKKTITHPDQPDGKKPAAPPE